MSRSKKSHSYCQGKVFSSGHGENSLSEKGCIRECSASGSGQQAGRLVSGNGPAVEGYNKTVG